MILIFFEFNKSNRLFLKINSKKKLNNLILTVVFVEIKTEA